MTSRKTFLDSWEVIRCVHRAAMEQPKMTAREWRVLVAITTEIAYYCRLSDHFTHERLGELACLHRNTVAKALDELAERGLIEYERGKFRGQASVIGLSKAHNHASDLSDARAHTHVSALSSSESAHISDLKRTRFGGKAHTHECATPSSSEPSREEGTRSNIGALVKNAADELPALLEDLDRQHHHRRVDTALTRLTERGLKFSWPSDLARALRNELADIDTVEDDTTNCNECGFTGPSPEHSRWHSNWISEFRDDEVAS